MAIKIMGSYFLIIHFPGGPLIMRTEDDTPDPPIALFKTLEEARATAMRSRACIAYGWEAFQVGSGEE